MLRADDHEPSENSVSNHVLADPRKYFITRFFNLVDGSTGAFLQV